MMADIFKTSCQSIFILWGKCIRDIFDNNEAHFGFSCNFEAKIEGQSDGLNIDYF